MEKRARGCAATPPARNCAELEFSALVAEEARRGGASDAAVAAAARLAELAEAAQLWQLLELRGCASAHPLPRCSVACLDEGWRTPASLGPEGDAAEVGLQLAAALDVLGHRTEALDALARALARRPESVRVRLARAKLLFRANCKEEAGEALTPLLEACRGHAAGSSLCLVLTPQQAGDAFYIAGWVRIHLDDHTAAYALWREGAQLLPGDARLVRQRRKFDMWGGDLLAEALLQLPSPLLGAGALGAAAACDSTPHVLPEGRAEPALALFGEGVRARRAVAFTSRQPLLSPAECRAVLAQVDDYVESALGGRWGTVRRSSVPTTDVAVEDIPALVPWLRSLLASRVFPFLSALFPRLADGSALEPGRLRVHDAFVVRYDERAGSLSLPEHSDTSALSVSLSLNEAGVDYEGGGLQIRALDEAISAPCGCLSAFMGPLKHGGAPITRGCRMILVLFLYVDGFRYGALLGHAGRNDAPKGPGAGAAGAGYVVYRETVTLMEALEFSEIVQ